MTRMPIKLALAALSVSVLPTGAVMAQNAPQNGVLLIFGNDKCPTNENGEEIVVCRRLDEAERFRIPKQLRDLQVTPQNQSWAVRQQDALTTGGTGPGSCSTVGPGGVTGCLARDITAAKREARSRRAAEQTPPQP